MICFWKSVVYCNPGLLSFLLPRRPEPLLAGVVWSLAYSTLPILPRLTVRRFRARLGRLKPFFRLFSFGINSSFHIERMSRYRQAKNGCFILAASPLARGRAHSALSAYFQATPRMIVLSPIPFVSLRRFRHATCSLLAISNVFTPIPATLPDFKGLSQERVQDRSL